MGMGILDSCNIFDYQDFFSRDKIVSQPLICCLLES